MTDPEVLPDVVVRTAVRLLPIPAHTDDFWARLDHALDAEGAPGALAPVVASEDPTPGASDGELESDPEPDLAPDPALALVPRALRRPSNALLVLVGAAAVVVVALSGRTLLDERNSPGRTAADPQPQAAAELDALIDGAQPAAPITISAAAEDASSDAVLAWVDDIHAGDIDDAWAAMGATSQAHFGSATAFEGQLASIAEGYDGWAESDPEQVLITPVQSSDESTLAVVTLVGTVTVDGEQHRRADAFPVRVLDGEAQLEPFALAGELELVVPAGVSEGDVLPPLPSGEELVVVVPSGADAPLVRLDDGTPLVCGAAEGTELTTLEETPGQRCSYLPTEGISTGEHTLTVVVWSADGTEISARSLQFDAA